MERRDFLKGLASIVLATQISGFWPNKEEQKHAFEELLKVYKAHPNPGGRVNILYPGSGTDIKPVQFARNLLAENLADNVNVVYTEVGGELNNDDFQKQNNDKIAIFHDGINDLTNTLTENLKPIFKHNPDIKPVIEKGTANNLYSAIIRYKINSPSGKRGVNLDVLYNMSKNRHEPTAEEIQLFGEKFIEEARTSYWPKKLDANKFYPAYFMQESFDDADIVVSHMSGDVHLLNFDLARAFRESKNRKRRILISDNSSGRLMEIMNKLGYSVRFDRFGDESYGYCFYYGYHPYYKAEEKSKCVTILTAEPKELK